MKNERKIIVLSLMFLSLSLTLINASSICNLNLATTEKMDTTGINDYYNTEYYYGFGIDILHAYYYDLDNDGIKDDVYTVVEVYTFSGYAEQVQAYIYQYLTLPSGKTYYLRVYVYGTGSYYRIYTRWYNVATESGWYLFEAKMENLNFFGYSYDESAVLFDPPKEGPDGAMPTASITLG